MVGRRKLLTSETTLSCGVRAPAAVCSPGAVQQTRENRALCVSRPANPQLARSISSILKFLKFSNDPQMFASPRYTKPTIGFPLALRRTPYTLTGLVALPALRREIVLSRRKESGQSCSRYASRRPIPQACVLSHFSGLQFCFF